MSRREITMSIESTMTRLISRTHAALFERTGGKLGGSIKGMPIVLLTTTGAKSGQPRKTPLMRVEHDGQYAIVASMGGAPKHPVWYWNVKAHPEVTLQDGAKRGAFVAREVTGDEKATWWKRAVAAYPEYEAYQRKTNREIPVFVLTPSDGAAA